MTMKRNTLIIAMLLLPLLGARAQYVTYNHDETKMNQVTVMETGAGELTPGRRPRSRPGGHLRDHRHLAHQTGGD